jgi:hypothetical protein
MKETLLQAVKKHAEGHIAKHIANIEVYLANPAGIGEHSDIIEAIEIELEQISKYQDQLDIVEKYFLHIDNGLIGGRGYTTATT